MSSPSPALQNQYKDLITRKNFVELGRLIEKTQTPPPENVVRFGYKTYLHEAGGNKVRLFLLMKLKELTSIEPDTGILKDACEVALSMDCPQVLEALIKRMGIDKIIFKEMSAILQKTYTNYVAQGKFIDIFKLMEITGSKPSEEIIQNGYRNYLYEAKFISFTGLKKRSGVVPDANMVLQVYWEYHSSFQKAKESDPDAASSWIRRIKKLGKITGIEPPEGLQIEQELGF
ncbi:MAG: hypothetical protein GY757_15050 [bacterium]|nr:hypothetical protein [bacterium]